MDRDRGLVGGDECVRHLGVPARHQARLRRGISLSAMRRPRDCERSRPAAGPGWGASEPDLEDVSRMWGSGWKRHFFPGFWLVYLGQPISAVAKYQHALPGQIAGYTIIAVFAVGYLAALPMGWNGAGRVFWMLYAGEFALTGAEVFFAHGDAFVFCVYLAVLTIAARHRLAPAIIAVLVSVTTIAPRFLPGDHKIDWTGGFSVFLVSIAMLGFFRIIQSN